MQPLHSGEWLGPYKIDSELGRGGMAVVYRAADRRGQVVALKVLTQPAAQERFQRETILQLRHPYIIRVYDAGQERGYHYIAMEYAPYGSLDKHLRQAAEQGQHLGLTLSLDIAMQIAQGLDYAHSHGVIHRDIKPSNILLDRRNGAIRAIITDFGVARLQDGQNITRDGALIGTPEYMSPEQARGYKADTRSDVYALGLVLYHMASGRPPVQADTPLAVLHKQVYETPPPIPHIPAAAHKLIFKAIDKKPEKRFQNISEMIAALQAARAEISPQLPARSTPPPVRPTPPSRLTSVEPVIYWLVGAAAILAVVMGLSLTQSTSPVRPLTSLSRFSVSTIVVTTEVSPTVNILPVTLPPTAPPPTVTPAPAPTRRPSTPTSAPAPAPVLLYPTNNTAWTSLDTPETLQWSWARPLADHEIFVVTVYFKKGDATYPAETCVKSTSFAIREFKWLIDPAAPAATSTQFEWTVQVRQQVSDDCQKVLAEGQVISQAQEKRRFEWVP